MPRPKKLYFVERGNVYCRLHNLGSTQAKRVKLCTLEELTHLPSGRKRSEAQQQAHLQALYNKVAQEKQQEQQRQEQAKLAPWFSDVVQEYLQEKRLSVMTQKVMARAATIFIEVNKELRLDQIKTIHFSRMSKFLLEGSRSPATVRSYFRHLKAVLHWAMKMELLDKMPAVELPPLPKKEPAVYTANDLQRMEDWLQNAIVNGPPHLQHTYQLQLRAFMLMSQTGCRVGEALHLLLDRIFLKEGVIAIKAIEGVWTPKWLKEGLLPISNYLGDFLEKDLSERKDAERWYLDSGFGGMAYTGHNGLNHAFLKLQTRLGIQGPKGNHGFRASVATSLLDKGIDSLTVQRLLRHSSIKVTEGYIKTSTALLHQAVDQLKKPNEIE